MSKWIKEIIVRYDEKQSFVYGNTLGEVVGELVRCKECKKAHLTYDGECKYCDEWKDDDGNYIEVYHDGNFYCGYGVRKENE